MFRWQTYRVVEAEGVGGIGIADVPSWTDGGSGPLGWRGTVRCSLSTEKYLSVVGK